jgi:hypothetical protein
MLRIDPNWLMAVMYLESGIDHRAINPYSGATGLIQFMPKTAVKLGTSTDSLLQMSNVEQLDFVFCYLQPYKGKIKSFTDLYLSVFFRQLSVNLQTLCLKTKTLPAALIARQNKGYDLNGNFEISKQEVETAILKRIKTVP